MLKGPKRSFVVVVDLDLGVESKAKLFLMGQKMLLMKQKNVLNGTKNVHTQ